MSKRDPAMLRFFALHLTRLVGIASLVAGLMVVDNSLFPALPDWVGYLLVINGMIDVFVIPQVLVRKWRTPRPHACIKPEQDHSQP